MLVVPPGVVARLDSQNDLQLAAPQARGARRSQREVQVQVRAILGLVQRGRMVQLGILVPPQRRVQVSPQAQA